MIPSIASRFDIFAGIADQMEQNEENTNHIQQQIFFKYLIELIQKQQQQNVTHSYLSSANHLNSNKDFSTEFSKHLINLNQQKSISINCISSKESCESDTSFDINQNDPYLQRRRKNNEAAKRSRDARRDKEDEIALRAALLEQENVKLRLENAHLKQENIQLHCQIYNSTKS